MSDESIRMGIMTADILAEELVKHNAALFKHIRGCSELELSALEAHYGIRLPSTYRRFLEVMGHEAGNLFVGTDVFYKHLFQLRDWAAELLARSAMPVLSHTAFVFLMHQGYQFMFFDTKGDAKDPAVWYYLEGAAAPEVRFPSFSDYLTLLANEVREGIYS